MTGWGAFWNAYRRGATQATRRINAQNKNNAPAGKNKQMSTAENKDIVKKDFDSSKEDELIKMLEYEVWMLP